MHDKPPPQHPTQEQLDILEQMDRGAKAMDYAWDNILRHRSRAFMAGYITKFFALYTASSTPAEAMAIFEAVRHGVEALGVGKPNQKEN